MEKLEVFGYKILTLFGEIHLYLRLDKTADFCRKKQGLQEVWKFLIVPRSQKFEIISFLFLNSLEYGTLNPKNRTMKYDYRMLNIRPFLLNALLMVGSESIKMPLGDKYQRKIHRKIAL